jgi:hypothetical protein
MTVMLPGSSTFTNWVNDLNRSLPALTIPIPTKGVDNWWEWVNQFIKINHGYELPTGDKKMFPKTDDWVKWANLFIQAVQTTELAG